MTKTKITTKERILHTVLFELVAIIIIGTLAFLFSKDNMAKLTGFGLFMSLTAMGWNYVFNLGFDKFFGENRMERTIPMRLFHGLSFEIGLMSISLPILMHLFSLSFLEVLALNIGMATGFLIYAISYNWCFDFIKHKYFIVNKI